MKKKVLLSIAFLVGLGVLCFAGCGLTLQKPVSKGLIVMEAWPTDLAGDRVLIRLTNKLAKTISVSDPEAVLSVDAEFPSEGGHYSTSWAGVPLKLAPGSSTEVKVNLNDYLKIHDPTEMGTHRLRLDYFVQVTGLRDSQVGEAYVWVLVAAGKIVRVIK